MCIIQIKMRVNKTKIQCPMSSCENKTETEREREKNENMQLNYNVA